MINQKFDHQYVRVMHQTAQKVRARKIPSLQQHVLVSRKLRNQTNDMEEARQCFYEQCNKRGLIAEQQVTQKGFLSKAQYITDDTRTFSKQYIGTLQAMAICKNPTRLAENQECRDMVQEANITAQNCRQVSYLFNKYIERVKRK